MVKTAIAFLLGCLITFNFSQFPTTFWWWATVVLLIISLLKKNVFFSALIIGLLWSSFHAHQQLNQRLHPELHGTDIVVTGRVVSLPQVDIQKTRFFFKPEAPNLPQKISLNWYAPYQLPKAGESWQLKIKLKMPRGLSNPGSFDYERWLFREHIGATGYVRPSTKNIRLASADWHDTQFWRQTISDKLREKLKNTQSLPLILGLTVGDRSAMTPVHWQTLQKTGTSHLLAISGLHIGLAALFLFFICRWLWSCSESLTLLVPAQKAGAVAALLAAISYAVLAGMTIPTQRALIMTTTVLVGLLSDRNFKLSNLLATSLLFVLIYDPFSVLSSGFWLSFTAVVLIILTSCFRYPTQKWQGLKVHFWLCFGLAPFTILFFQQASIIAPIANLLAVPFISFVIIPLSLISTALLWATPKLSLILFNLCDWMLNQFWSGLSLLSQIDVAVWQTAALPTHIIILAATSVFLLVLPKGLPAKGLGLVGLIPAFVYSPTPIDEGNMRVAVLDVGQGTASVIETHKHVLVFDTGRYVSEQFDMGKSVVAPYLLFRNINSIDKLIISHSDNDHIGGLASLTEVIPATETISSDISIGPNTHPCSDGQSWQWDGVLFEFLNPLSSQQGNENNLSCVLKVTSQNFSVLLTGDIEKETELKLINRVPNKLNSTLLSVPHHGSRTSSSTPFIDHVSPQIASFSLGYQNQYHFPAPEVIKRYEQRGVSVLRTDYSGAQIFTWHPTQFLQVVQWRDAHQKIWSSSPTE